MHARFFTDFEIKQELHSFIEELKTITRIESIFLVVKHLLN